MNPADVSIVIVNYKTSALLSKCLSSLYEQCRDVSFEVTVYDNASNDGGLSEVEAAFPDVRFIYGPENAGYARANNQAIAASGRSSYYLLLNPDVIFRSNAVKIIADFMDEHPGIGICGPKVVLPGGKLDAPCRRAFKTPAIYLYNSLGLSRLFPNSRRFGRYYLSYLDENELSEVDSVIGAFLMIRRQTVAEIGLLDDDYYIYGEDEDWCWQAKQAGWKIFYNPAAVVVHQKGSSTGSRKLPMIFHWHRAAYRFHRKNLSSSYHFAVNGLVYAGIAVHLFFSLFFNTLKLGRKRFQGGG